MTIALVSHASASGESGVATTAGFNSTGATLLTAVCGYLPGAGGTFTSIADSNGNTWSLLTAQENLTGCRLAYVQNPVVGAGHTVTFTSGASLTTAVAVAAWSGTAVASVFDQQNGATNGGSGSTLQTGSITPSAANAVIVSGCCSYTAANNTIDLGFSIADAIYSGLYSSAALAYLIQTAATAENPTWTEPLGPGIYLAVVIASFLAGGGGGGGVLLRTAPLTGIGSGGPFFGDPLE